LGLGLISAQIVLLLAFFAISYVVLASCTSFNSKSFIKTSKNFLSVFNVFLDIFMSVLHVKIDKRIYVMCLVVSLFSYSNLASFYVFWCDFFVQLRHMLIV